VLAVGTELTSGQIVNRNAAWISEKLEIFGVETVAHLCVPDDRARILQALNDCERDADWIFVTGGLGPTSDDFTRDVVASWLGRELRYDESSWAHIQDRMALVGLPVAPSNRQQCYYPEGSQVLVNLRGTANGFAIQKGGKRIWVFPGPPAELEAVWTHGVVSQISGAVPKESRLQLDRWHCVGRSEAELAESVERAVAGLGENALGAVLGYRAHRPYVEVKLWSPGSWDASRVRAVRRVVEGAIGPESLACKDDEDLAVVFIERLKVLLGRQEFVLRVDDESTEWRLVERLRGVVRRGGSHQSRAGIQVLEGQAVRSERSLACDVRLSIQLREDQKTWCAQLELPQASLAWEVARVSPFALGDRTALWLVEWAMLALLREVPVKT
jgi:nicotinamide-nucleotide amidase